MQCSTGLQRLTLGKYRFHNCSRCSPRLAPRWSPSRCLSTIASLVRDHRQRYKVADLFDPSHPLALGDSAEAEPNLFAAFRGRQRARVGMGRNHLGRAIRSPCVTECPLVLALCIQRPHCARSGHFECAWSCLPNDFGPDANCWHVDVGNSMQRG